VEDGWKANCGGALIGGKLSLLSLVNSSKHGAYHLIVRACKTCAWRSSVSGALRQWRADAGAFSGAGRG
jgi:hypothetical protein